MSDLDRLDNIPVRKGTIILKFDEDPELVELLVKYKNNVGWTWKRLFLMGFANMVAKNGDAPDLIVRIADYMEGRR